MSGIHFSCLNSQSNATFRIFTFHFFNPISRNNVSLIMLYVAHIRFKSWSSAVLQLSFSCKIDTLHLYIHTVIHDVHLMNPVPWQVGSDIFIRVSSYQLTPAVHPLKLSNNSTFNFYNSPTLYLHLIILIFIIFFEIKLVWISHKCWMKKCERRVKNSEGIKLRQHWLSPTNSENCTWATSPACNFRTIQ